ncbi:hypothetical protein [Halococcus sp. AFM35]|uniref:hypothetical protein n=1 Tax=Halococcus sp. AFM35 TaxID=3421653 RepID=UPI003EBA7BBF
MAFSVLTVLRQSLRRLATGPALLVLLGLALVQTIARFVPGQFARPTPGVIGAGGGGSPVVFTGNPLPILAGLVVALVGVYLALVTIRVFAGQWGIVEREHLTHRVGFGVANLLGISIVLAVAAVIGVFVTVLGGLVGAVVWLVAFLVLVAVSFFTPAFIAIEDDNVLTAFKKSFGVLRRSPVRVAALLVALVVVNAILQAVGSAVAGAVASVPVVGPFVLALVSGLGSVFLWVAIARAYDHLETTAV